MQRVKSLTRPESAKAHIDFLKKNRIPYMLRISNYTIEIVSELFNIQYVQSMRSKKCFAAFAKVKSDVKKHAKPKIDKANLRYFDHDFDKDFFAPYVINIDLRSAYASILHNCGYLSNDTFEYLQSLHKLDRLASVGMLASKKYEFWYNRKGELESFEKVTSDLEDFFYYAVRETDIVMTDLKKIGGEDYLFSWVDGAYFEVNDELLYAVQDYLQNHSYKWTVEIVYQFTVKITNGKAKLSFWKEATTEEGYHVCKLKIFNIPSKNSLFATDIINYLTNINIHDEKIDHTKVGKRQIK